MERTLPIASECGAGSCGRGYFAFALGISRGSVCYLARPTSDADLVLMRRIDELHLEHPFAGSRMLRVLLKAEGREVGRRHVSTLMKKMGIEAIYRRPNASKPGPGAQGLPLAIGLEPCMDGSCLARFS